MSRWLLRCTDSSQGGEISDNGVGISPDLLPKIFDLFIQADRTLDRAQGGLGVGLSVVKKLIEMHGGKVLAFSRGLGRGSTFSITLPRCHPPSTRRGQQLAQPVASKRILIVDDNIDGVTALAQILRIDGHECETAYSALEGLQRAASSRLEVVLLDIGRPIIDGYEIARRLRQNRQLDGTRIIALTGYGQAEDRERALAAGFDDHFAKPLDFARLQRALAEVPSKVPRSMGS